MNYLDASIRGSLFGLDGKIKLQENRCISIDQILYLIDSMPMRKNEIRSKN